MRFKVTLVRQGTVYYRPVSGGGTQCCPVEDFAQWAFTKEKQNS